MKIFLADDHVIFLESMTMLLSVIEGIELVGTACCGEEVLKKIIKTEAEILICDYYMPNMDGVELTFKLREIMPDIKVLILTSRDDAEGIKMAIQAGVKGFLSKKVSKNELNTALQTVFIGSNYYSETVIKTLANDPTDTQNKILPIHESLTNREIEIIKLIAQEMTGTNVAEALNLSTHTIASHRKNIFHKLNINSTYALIKYAIEHRLI